MPMINGSCMFKGHYFYEQNIHLNHKELTTRKFSPQAILSNVAIAASAMTMELMLLFHHVGTNVINHILLER